MSLISRLGPPVKQQIPMETAMMIRATRRVLSAFIPLPSIKVYELEPIMMVTMKQANTIPNGGSDGIRMGVHKKTKIYMTDSTTVCISPSRKICVNNNF
jgi:hypothetical protein